MKVFVGIYRFRQPTRTAGRVSIDSGVLGFQLLGIFLIGSKVCWAR